MATIGNRPGGPSAAIEVTAPDDWYVKESFTLIAPDGQANVILSSEPLDPEITTEQYATVQGDLLEGEFPGYRPLRYEPFALRGEGDGLLRVFEWKPPDGVPVTQAQIYYAARGRGYTSTGTTPSSNFENVRATLFEILRSIAVRSTPGPAA